MNDHRGEFVHGVTCNGYSNRACRCAECRAVWAAYCLKRRKERLAAGPPEHLHGTYNCYLNYACRCELCRAAHAAYSVGYQQRKKSRASA